jgi:hypothetical protein
MPPSSALVALSGSREGLRYETREVFDEAHGKGSL